MIALPSLAAPLAPFFRGRTDTAATRVAAIVVCGRNGVDLTRQLDTDEGTGTCFGCLPLADGAALTRVFTIHNAGGSVLWISGTGLEGTGADQFEIMDLPAAAVAPGGSTAFTIRYRPTREGQAFALVLLSSNDAEECPYLFLIEGQADVALASVPRSARA